MNVLVQQMSADIQEGGHSCPPIINTGGLENPSYGAGEGKCIKRDSGGGLWIVGRQMRGKSKLWMKQF